MTGRSIFSLLATIAVFGSASVPLAPAAAQDRSYSDSRDLPWQSQGTVKDGYPEPVPAPSRGYREPSPQTSYKDDGPPPVVYRRKSSACLTKPDLRLALKEQGWHNFDEVDYRRDNAVMTADNEHGRRFEVAFDACHGHVVEARPVVAYAPPPTVYYERPRYYGAPRYYGERAYYGYDGYYGRSGYGPRRPYVGVYAERRWDRR